MTIGVIYPDSGNLTSILDMLARLNRPAKVLKKPELTGITQLFLPGQGRFGAVMRYLVEHEWVAPLREWVQADKPVVGVCVGMQVLFAESEEDPGVKGLGVLPGRVTRLNAPKLPMVGWAPVRFSNEWESGNAYFVNGYAAETDQNVIAVATHGRTFPAAVRAGNTIAFQFHPEKSGVWGKELLDRCLIS